MILIVSSDVEITLKIILDHWYDDLGCNRVEYLPKWQLTNSSQFDGEKI